MHLLRALQKPLTILLCAAMTTSSISLPANGEEYANDVRYIDAVTAANAVSTDLYNSMLLEIRKQSVLNDYVEEKKNMNVEKERAYTRMQLSTGSYITDDQEAYIEQADTIEAAVVNTDYSYMNTEGHITPEGGVYSGPSGKETYYNLPMGGVIYLMRHLGYSEEEYPYWIRDDGVKMFGSYVMVAADLSLRPKGTVLESSMGLAIVCDTGDLDRTQLDIAVNW